MAKLIKRERQRAVGYMSVSANVLLRGSWADMATQKIMSANRAGFLTAGDIDVMKL